MNLPMIQVLIAEDSNEFREGLRDLLNSVIDMRLVGESVNGVEAVELARRLQPDVILMDLQMPKLNGIEATRRILSTSPHMAILMLTMYDDDESVFAAMRSGAKGYILKGALKNEILRAIRGVAAGEAILGPPIAGRMVSYFSQLQSAAVSFPELTEREQEILSLMAQNHPNREIARSLQISQKTVQNHVSNILAKMQVAGRTQAMIRARQKGLGRDTS